MNINDFTLGQIKEIQSLFSAGNNAHGIPQFDNPVVAQFIGRFVFVCNLHIKGDFCYLTNVRNVRYWGSRDNGLGDLAKNGANDDDKIDSWGDQIIPLDKLGPVMSASKEHWS